MMRDLTSLLAVALTLGCAGASASPLAGGAVAIAPSDGLATAIHHKPGHRGGPPWTRDRERRGGDDRDFDRESYRDSDERPSYRRQVCRTTYREVYDRYEDEYVTRPVRVCRSEY